MNIHKINLNSVNFGMVTKAAKERAAKMGVKQETIDELSKEQEKNFSFDIDVAPSSYTGFNFCVRIKNADPLYLFETLEQACQCSRGSSPYTWVENNSDIPKSEL